MCFICPVIGIHEPILRPGYPKLKDWIDDEKDETRKSIWNKIRKNMYKYYLGNNVEFASFRKAAEFLFNRDYKDKKQIFVPEVYLTKAPEIIFYEKKQIEELIKAMSDENLSKQEKTEKEKLKSRLKTIAGEEIEKKVYDTLKAYYELHDDQQVLVLHGYEIADLEKLAKSEDVGHWEKDFLIINVTYGYIMNIEAKSSLNIKSLNEAKTQLLNTRKILEKWFGADLSKGWKFISAIYCERNDKTNKNCKSKMDFIFTGTEDLKEKIDKIHESLLDDSRFN